VSHTLTEMLTCEVVEYRVNIMAARHKGTWHEGYKVVSFRRERDKKFLRITWQVKTHFLRRNDTQRLHHNDQPA